ncbi:signal peptide peptidase SppA [Eubacteriales bacterium KG127]
MEKISIDTKNKKNKNKGLWIFLSVVGIIFVMALIIFFIGKSNKGGSVSKVNGKEYESINVTGNYIGRLYVNGTIKEKDGDSVFSGNSYFHGETLNAIDQMIQDKGNKALLISVNSPGGSVSASDDLYLKIIEYKEKTGRPVFVYFENMAASGGYYISAAADKILSNRNCWTGSIGVTLGNKYDTSELLAKLGVKARTITSGPNKAMGDPVSGLSDEHIKIFQGIVDEAYEQFVDIVSKGRDIPIDDVKKIADGRIYTAKQAKEIKLIDEIMTREKAEEYVLSKIGGKDTNIQDIVFKENSNLSGLFSIAQRDSLDRLTDKLMNFNGKFSISYMAPIDEH